MISYLSYNQTLTAGCGSVRETLVMYAGLAQCEALMYGYRAQNFRGKRKICMLVLYVAVAYAGVMTEFCAVGLLKT